jgi:hypothetical protein
LISERFRVNDTACRDAFVALWVGDAVAEPVAVMGDDAARGLSKAQRAEFEDTRTAIDGTRSE